MFLGSRCVDTEVALEVIQIPKRKLAWVFLYVKKKNPVL
jgi:hypothetical protein